MPRTPSIRLTDTAKPIAEKNARARGFNNQSKELAELAKTTVSTLKRFWAQDGINRFTFEDISKELGFDNWQDIGEEVTPGNKKEQVTSDQKEHVKPNTQSVAHNIPRTISGPFIGRDLVEFHHVVQGATESNIVNVVGMGGIGKTELTMRYGREFQAEYPKGVCWIDVRAGKITQQLLRYFKAILKLSFPDNLKTAQAKLVYGFAAWPGIREALIIFDDVDDFSQVSPYIPTDETFKVIITSRKTFNNTFITYSLDELSESEALEVIKGILKPDDERLTTQLSSIQEVCDYVEYLPLGLQLIARFAKQMPTWPFIWIYQQLKDYELKAESLTKTEPLMSPCPRGVKAALELSWDHLKKNPLTQHLACLLSLFGTNYTLLPYITSCMPNQEPQKLEVLLKLQLVNFSIVQEYVFPDDLYGEVAIYKLHHLVYLFLKSKLNKADKDGAIRRQFCSFFSEYADLYRFQNTIKGRIADYHILLPIIERIYLEYRKYLTCAAHDLARLSNIAAILNQTQGQAIEAREWFHSCIFHTRCAYGRHSKREAFVRSKLLDLPEANPKIIGEVQADIHRFIHKDLDYTQALTYNLASYFRNRYLVKEAHHYLQLTLQLNDKSKSENKDFLKCRTLNALGDVYCNWKMYDKALACLLEAQKLLNDMVEIGKSIKRSFLEEALSETEAHHGRYLIDEVYFNFVEIRILLYSNFGKAFVETEEYQKAEYYAVEALKLLNKNGLASSSQAYDALVILEKTYWKSNQHKRSICLFSRILRLELNSKYDDPSRFDGHIICSKASWLADQQRIYEAYDFVVNMLQYIHQEYGVNNICAAELTLYKSVAEFKFQNYNSAIQDAMSALSIIQGFSEAVRIEFALKIYQFLTNSLWVLCYSALIQDRLTDGMKYYMQFMALIEEIKGSQLVDYTEIIPTNLLDGLSQMMGIKKQYIASKNLAGLIIDMRQSNPRLDTIANHPEMLARGYLRSAYANFMIDKCLLARIDFRKSLKILKTIRPWYSWELAGVRYLHIFNNLRIFAHRLVWVTNKQRPYQEYDSQEIVVTNFEPITLFTTSIIPLIEPEVQDVQPVTQGDDLVLA